MVPLLALIGRDCGLTPGRDLAAQPLHLLRAGGPVVESAHLAPLAVAGTDEQMGVMVALVPVSVGPVHRPHDRHAPACRNIGGDVAYDLGATGGRHRVRQSNDHLAGHS